MTCATMNRRGAERATYSTVLALCFLFCACIPAGAVDRANLALKKPASSSSVENDEHGSGKANDGDPDTCWRADDEPEAGPEWWQVDLQEHYDLAGCQILWQFDGKRYRYRVEGSTDRKNWSILSDQTKSTVTSRIHNLRFRQARQVRYLKITVTGLDEGCWVSICEVKVYGVKQPKEAP